MLGDMIRHIPTYLEKIYIPDQLRCRLGDTLLLDYFQLKVESVSNVSAPLATNMSVCSSCPGIKVRSPVKSQLNPIPASVALAELHRV